LLKQLSAAAPNRATYAAASRATTTGTTATPKQSSNTSKHYQQPMM